MSGYTRTETHKARSFEPICKMWLMAICTLVTIPPIFVFFFTQRYFGQGLVVTGVKGQTPIARKRENANEEYGTSYLRPETIADAPEV